MRRCLVLLTKQDVGPFLDDFLFSGCISYHLNKSMAWKNEGEIGCQNYHNWNSFNLRTNELYPVLLCLFVPWIKNMNDRANTTLPFTYIDRILHMHILVITCSYDIIPILEKIIINKKMMGGLKYNFLVTSVKKLANRCKH